MQTIKVVTQAELDAALLVQGATVIINSDSGRLLSVRASDSATVEAYDSATVRAGSHVAVHRHSDRCVIGGGVVIDHAGIDLADFATWAAYGAVEIMQDGRAILYKATDENFTAGHGFNKPTVYAVGSVVTAGDWRDDHDCGGGLHVSPTPSIAASFRKGKMRFLKVAIDPATARTIGPGKTKAPSLEVLAEVDAFGREI